jgi:hypothetical protein
MNKGEDSVMSFRKQGINDTKVVQVALVILY